MMDLFIDTNIFLEIFLEQENSKQSKEIFNLYDKLSFYTSDYVVHSIGILLFKRKNYNLFYQFIDDLLIRGVVRIINLDFKDLTLVIDVAKKYSLDFDDAYQYVCAEKYDLTIVSFDSDFDKTSKRRKTPDEILNRLID